MYSLMVLSSFFKQRNDTGQLKVKVYLTNKININNQGKEKLNVSSTHQIFHILELIHALLGSNDD